MTKCAAIWGTLGAVWMLLLIWARSPRLVYLTNLPALLVAALFARIDRGAFKFYATFLLNSAIHWGMIGLLVRAILHKIWK